MKLLFSSWNNEIVDSRGLEPEQWKDAPSVKLPADFDRENTIAGFMGWAGIILLKDSVDIVDMCLRYTREVNRTSCGKCFPCRIGTAIMENTLKKIVDGQGQAEDLTKLRNLGQYISETSKCYIGKTGPVPILHAIEHFRDAFEQTLAGKKPKSASVRYASKWTAPCYSACPAGMNIPAYVECISENRVLDALRITREASPMAASLGRACFHPCEKNCRRSNVDEAVSICKLKRFAWDYEDLRPLTQPENANPHTRPDKVAIIGAGPAGLSAAYYLALKGYRATVFDALPVPGGMVGVGIPEYRVPKEVLGRETAFVEKMGVEIRYNTPIGQELTIPRLQKDGYKAFLVATGAHLSKKIGVEGEDDNLDGFLRGIDYLRDCVTTRCLDMKGKRILVVGGGNVAMDCCRSPIRNGAKEVTIVYRRTKKELPADPHEVHDSEIEGVKYVFLTAPKKIISRDGKVTGLECLKMELGEPDASGRRRPVPVEGSEFVIPADVIIQAIGQDCDLSVLNGVDGVQTTRWGTITADPQTFQTNVPYIFTAGDVFNGPLTIVDACGNARRAAESIHQFLTDGAVTVSTDEKLDRVFKTLGVDGKNETPAFKETLKRVPMPVIPLDRRVTSFAEVETGYDLRQAIEEASRCLRCYQMGMVALEK